MTGTHHEQPHASSDEVATVRDLIKDEKIAMLTTVATDGSLVSRPMGDQAVDIDGCRVYASPRPRADGAER